jgi:hypothetical protein
MRSLPAILALVLACAASAPALAQGESAASDIAPSAAASSAPMALEALEAEHGQGVSNNVLSEQQLNATNSGNSVITGMMKTGDVAFSTSALTGFAGVGNFVINTGNNSNLQGTISVNIVTNAPPL